MFALAVINRFRLLRFKYNRRETGPFVFAIAKWLGLRMPARAVGVFFSGFDLDLLRKACGDFRLVHPENYP